MPLSNPPRRILLIKLRHHGDVLLTTPVAHALKTVWPDAEIDMLIYRETWDMVRHNPDLSQIHWVDRRWKKQGRRHLLQQEWRLWRRLQQRHYDVVINLSDQWRGALVAKLCARDMTIGFQYGKRDRALWRACYTHLLPELGPDTHMVLNNLSALAPLHLPPTVATAPVVLQVQSEHRTAVQALLQAQGWAHEPYILVHPGSRWLFKCWDDDKMAALLQGLLADGHHIVLTAAPDAHEQAMISALLSRIRLPESGGRIYSLAGQLNLMQLAAVIASAQLFIGVDSVPMHMAAALGTPGVALFGPSWLARWRPWSDRISVVYAGDYGHLPHPDSIDTADPTRLLTAIPLEAVQAAVASRLNPVQAA